MILPNDSTRIADENSLLITDIVVELEDGSIVNVEIQKIGYMFPGQRCACYSSDLLLRQYKRVRDKSKSDKFSYRDIKTVYLIVFIEQSGKEFKAFPDTYLHHSKQVFDTGLELEMLQEFYMIPLDIFRQTQHNKGSITKLDAWLHFISNDDPEVILRVMEAYPQFRTYYEELYQMCLNVEELMNMFSEELRILDRNTTLLMIDEMQEEMKREISKAQEEASKAQEEVLQYKHQIIQFMLNEGDTDDKIQRATGLSLEEIAKIRSGMSE